MTEDQGMGSEERKLAEDQRASLEELKDMLEHIETDAMPADMMAVLLKHLPADVLDSVLDGDKIDWAKLKTLSLD
jgi:hypothetical protein